jgi:formylglycine-generating enzyme
LGGATRRAAHHALPGQSNCGKLRVGVIRRRSCGKVGGGRVALNADGTPGGAVDDPNQSQWYSACSQGGQTLFPYGNDLDVTRCEGYAVAFDSTGTLLPKKDVATLDGCRGSTEPYASIYDMSGSVREWTDECGSFPFSGLMCAVRGGSFGSQTADQLGCEKQGESGVNSADNGSGFRCCKDLL